jgi:hypothetical protein
MVVVVKTASPITPTAIDRVSLAVSVLEGFSCVDQVIDILYAGRERE